MRKLIENLSPAGAWCANFLLLLVVGWIDLLIGVEFSVLPLYFVPVAFAAWRFGGRISFLFGLLGGLTWLWCELRAGHPYANPYAPYWNSLMRVVFFSIGGVILARLHQHLMDRERLITELQKLLAQVKTLEGILPVCPCCGKIRTRKGTWDKLETYVKDQTNVEFMSNTCPECSKIHQPSSTSASVR